MTERIEDYNRPLYSLSIREFMALENELHEKKLLGIVQKIITDVRIEQKKEEPDTISLAEACTVTGYQRETIYSKICRLEIPVLTRNRPVMFSRAELQLWMKLGRPRVAEMELMKRKGQI